jgi:hypothetical protein
MDENIALKTASLHFILAKVSDYFWNQDPGD